MPTAEDLKTNEVLQYRLWFSRPRPPARHRSTASTRYGRVAALGRAAQLTDNRGAFAFAFELFHRFAPPFAPTKRREGQL